MYASPPKTVFMKTVARCPSDTSSGAGTGTAPLRELKGHAKMDKDREKTTRKVDSKTNGTYKNREGGVHLMQMWSEITSKSVFSKSPPHLSLQLFIPCSPPHFFSFAFFPNVSAKLEKVESTLPLSLIPPPRL